MNRRLFMSIALGMVLAPALAFAASPEPLKAISPGGTIPYTPEIHKAVKKSNMPYILDFYASWCGTCRAQSRAIDNLRSKNADYNNVTVLKIDWDTYRLEPITKDLRIPRRSTLVLLRGENEIDRIVASTRSDDIQRLLDLGLANGQ